MYTGPDRVGLQPAEHLLGPGSLHGQPAELQGRHKLNRSLWGPHYLFLSGEEMLRGEFEAMLGISDRSATNAWSRWSTRVAQVGLATGQGALGLLQDALCLMFL